MEIFNIEVGSAACPIHTIVSAMKEDDAMIKDWSTFARSLGIPNAKILKHRQDLQLDKITFSDLVWDVLETWIGMCGSNAKMTTLLLILEAKCGFVNVAESIRRHFNLPNETNDIHSSILYQDLDQALQAKVKDTLKLQYSKLDIENIAPKLNGTVLAKLMSGKRPKLFKRTLPKKLNCYVNRTIVTRNIISHKIFEKIHSESNIFLFTGIERHKLSSFLQQSGTGHSSNQIKQGNLTVNFIILDSPMHFDKICKLTDKPVHLFNVTFNKLKWVKSSGKTTTVRACVASTSQDELNETEFCKKILSNSNQPVCISDSPGMGKSVFLGQIGRRLAQIHPERNVIFLAFHQLMSSIKQSGTPNNLIPIELALNNLICENTLGSAVLKSLKNMEHENISVELLLDGFDEVDLPDRDLAHETLETILTCYKSIRLWVTTRPHFLQDLESTLNTLGYNILPFCESDQIHYLTSYWNRDANLNQKKLTMFAHHCLETLRSKTMTEVNEIAGIPLQCLLIAEVYEEEAKAYGHIGQSSSALPVMLITTITNLYENLIKRKFQKMRDPEDIESLLNMHIQLSLKEIFPEHYENLKEFFGSINMENILKCGIVETSGKPETVRFIHRTFAEYFLACFAAQILNLSKGSKTDEYNFFLIEGVLKCQCIKRSFGKLHCSINSYLFSQPVICYFFNSFSSRLQDNSTSTANSLISSAGFQKQKGKIAHACANANYLQLLKFLNKFNAFKSNDIFTLDYFYLTVTVSSLEIFKVALANFEDRNHNLNTSMLNIALRLGVKRGKFSIVEFLIKERGLHKTLKTECETIKLIIHECVTHSSENSAIQIEQKTQIIRIILDINHSFLEVRNDEGKTPILCVKIHMGLMRELVDLGANVLAQDFCNDSVIHICKDHLSNEEYYSLLTMIPAEKLMQLVNLEGLHGDTVLSGLLKRVDAASETLERLKDLEANFNHIDIKGNSILANAILWKRNMKTIKNLIECGADINWRGRHGQSLAHIASRAGNIPLVTELIRLGVDPCIQNNYKNTILHLNVYEIPVLSVDDPALCEDYNSVMVSIPQEKMKELVRLKNRFGHTPLMTLVSRTDPLPGTLDGFKCVGADFNCSDEHGDSLLAKAVISWRSEATILKLIECGADVYWKKGWERRTLLHFAAECGNSEAVAVLVEWIDENVKDWSWKTPLEYAQKSRTEKKFNMGLEMAKKIVGSRLHCKSQIML